MAKFCSSRSLDILINSIKLTMPSGGRGDWLKENVTILPIGKKLWQHLWLVGRHDTQHNGIQEQE
jgi:hypothetical protein